MVKSNGRVSSAAMVSSRRSSSRRSLRSAFLLEELRAATAGTTPEDAEERVKEDVEVEAVLRLDELDEVRSAASEAEEPSRVGLRCAAMLLQVRLCEGGMTV